MRIILLILINTVLFSNTLIAQSEKELILESSEGTPKIFAFQKTIRQVNEKVYLWTSTEYHVDNDTLSVDVIDNGLMYCTLKELYLFNIKTSEYKILSKVFIDENGITVRKTNIAEYECDWEYIEPETKQEGILNYLTEKTTNRK